MAAREPSHVTSGKRVSVIRPHGYLRGGVLLLSLLAVLGFSSSAFAETKTETFKASKGSSFEFKVPAGVTQVEVTAVGGAGGAGEELEDESFSCVAGAGGPGGSGAKLTATLNVSPGEKLHAVFGGGGSGGGSCASGAGGGRSELMVRPC